MKNLIKKELYFALSSYSIYIVVILFLLCNSLLIWVFNNDSNILNNNLASLESFFNISPLILIMFIPAITMSLIAKEKNLGTMEVISTLPLRDIDFVLGKLNEDEHRELFSIFPKICEVIISFVMNGIDSTMNSYNLKK